MLPDDELATVLATGWQQAADDYETPVSVTVGTGLYARLGYDAQGVARIAVWRKGGTATEAEADALATATGMERWQSSLQGKYWVVQEIDEGEPPEYEPLPTEPEPAQEAQQAPDPSPTPQTAPQPLRGPVCGTCAHGVPDAYGDIECDLGWEAHDPEMFTSYPHPTKTKPNGKAVWINEAVTMPHPGVPFPIMTRNCRCMCREDRWTPKRRVEKE